MFALELLRWRRRGYRTLVTRVIEFHFEQHLPDLLRRVPIPVLPARVLDLLNVGIQEQQWLGPVKDLAGFDRLRAKMPGLNPSTVAASLRLDARTVAGILGGSLQSGPGIGGVGTTGPLGDVLDGTVIGGVGGRLVVESFDHLAGPGAGELVHLGDIRGGMMPRWGGG
jgi:hypothetical protein